MIAFVRSLTSSRAASGSIPRVSSSQSANTIRAPVAVTAWRPAQYVIAGQITSSPGSAPESRTPSWIAAVQLLRATR